MTKNTPLFIVAATLLALSGCSAQETIDSKEKETMEAPLLAKPNLPDLPTFNIKQRDTPESTESALEEFENVRQLFDSTKVPPALNQDLTIDRAREQATSLRLLKLQRVSDIEWLKSLDVERIAGNDQIETQKLGRLKTSLLSRLEKYLPNEIEHSEKYSRSFIRQSIEPASWAHIAKAADIDMNDQTAVKNRFGNELLTQSIATQIVQKNEAFAAAILFDRILGTDSGYEPIQSKFQSVVDRYRQKLASATESIQFPEGIDKPALLNFAKQAFDDKQIPFQRMSVISDQRSQSNDHYLVDFGEREIEKSEYRWKEFQVATIEKEGDRFFLWYTTVMYYSSGPATVPLEKWVLGPRHKSAPISEKQID